MHAGGKGERNASSGQGRGCLCAALTLLLSMGIHVQVGTISPRLCNVLLYSRISITVLEFSPLSLSLFFSTKRRRIVKTMVIHGAKGGRYLVRD